MFKYVRDNGGRFEPVIKTITANTGVTYADGDALVITSGKAAKCGATTKPEYICATKGSGLSEVAAYQVLEGQEYKTTFYGDGTAVAVGAKVTLHTDSAQVTGTTTSGVAEVIKKFGTGASGTEVLIRF
jgi:hypothetical protein